MRTDSSISLQRLTRGNVAHAVCQYGGAEAQRADTDRWVDVGCRRAGPQIGRRTVILHAFGGPVPAPVPVPGSPDAGG